MVRKIGLVLIVLPAFAGCGKKIDPELALIEPVIDETISRFRMSGVRNQWDRYNELMQATTNRELRARYAQCCRRKLLAVEIGGDDYATQSRIFNRVAEGLLPDQTTTTAWRWTIEDDCAAHIGRLKWMRHQLDKWKTMVGGSAERLCADNPAKFKEWCESYASCLGKYETSRAMLEEGFDCMCKVLRATAEERRRAKMMVEDYLGWKIRPKEEVDALLQSGAKSEEMKAIGTCWQWM